MASSDNHEDCCKATLAAAGAAAALAAFGIRKLAVSPKVELDTYAPEPKENYSTYDRSQPMWTIDPAVEMPIRVSQSGYASRQPETVNEIFEQAVKRHPNGIALKHERDGVWTSLTYTDYYAQTRRVARALIACGLKQTGTVAIIGFNSPEWHLANMGAILAGGKAAGIYTSNGPDSCKYITEHSGAAVVVCENENQLEKFLEIRDQLPNLKKIVMWTGDVPASANTSSSQAKVVSWSEFLDLADATLESVLEERIAAQKPGHACTLIYTSGTTGPPKAVMISHDNCTWTAGLLVTEGGSDIGNHGTNEDIVSYLPLSHIAAQILDVHVPLWTTAKQDNAFTVWFAQPTALKGTLVATLQAARPTIFFGVPRVWEKIAEKMKAVGATTKGLKRKIANWAKDIGSRAAVETSVGGSGQRPLFFPLADKLVFSKVKQNLGLNRCHMFASAAAPIQPSTIKFFEALDINICQGYGMSECTGPQFVEKPRYRKAGTCGPALTGLEWKIDHHKGRDKEGQGEICFRGRHIMMGYMHNEVKTKDSIDVDGWLHSGDVGTVDKTGLLKITGRIKEIIITAGGENIAPVPIEQLLKANLPAVSNLVMIGDKRKFCSALVTLQQDVDQDGRATGHLAGAAKAVSAQSSTLAEAKNDPKWQQYIQDAITDYNKNHIVSRAQKIQKFVILDGDFSTAGGELTATLKMKRSIVSEMYASDINGMYD